jgi:hypothetical protein
MAGELLYGAQVHAGIEGIGDKGTPKVVWREVGDGGGYHSDPGGFRPWRARASAPADGGYYGEKR